MSQHEIFCFVLCFLCNKCPLLWWAALREADGSCSQRARGKDTHPADGHHVVAYQHSSHELGLDALSQQDLLEVRQARLIDEHRLMSWNLEGEREPTVRDFLRRAVRTAYSPVWTSVRSESHYFTSQESKSLIGSISYLFSCFSFWASGHDYNSFVPLATEASGT